MSELTLQHNTEIMRAAQQLVQTLVESGRVKPADEGETFALLLGAIFVD